MRLISIVLLVSPVYTLATSEQEMKSEIIADAERMFRFEAGPQGVIRNRGISPVPWKVASGYIDLHPTELTRKKRGIP